MRKAIKIAGIAVGGVLALMALALAAIMVLSEIRLNQTFKVQGKEVEVPNTATAVTEGQRQFTIRACADCHGEDLAGVVFIDGLPGRAMGANLTRGEGGVGGIYTNADFERAIRHGVRPNGKGIPVMPVTDYYNMSDVDLGNLIAYIRSVPPVNRPHEGPQIGLLFRALYVFGQVPLLAAEVIDHNATLVAPKPGVSAEYGKYLATTCTGCHTPTFAGGPILGRPDDSPPAANLTPAGNLSMWTQDDFIRILRTGMRPNGKPIDNANMPWRSFAHMTDDELKSIWLYLRTVPPVETKKG